MVFIQLFSWFGMGDILCWAGVRLWIMYVVFVRAQPAATRGARTADAYGDAPDVLSGIGSGPFFVNHIGYRYSGEPPK
jgi:hypothetical protein